jgi:OPA family glycerol-3-phosphate transporter-like MFS transporter
VMQPSRTEQSNPIRQLPTRAISPGHVLIANWLAYATLYFPRLAFAASKLGLLADPSLSLTRSFLGVADASFLTVYAAGQFVSGTLAERIGPRRLVVLGLFSAGLAAGTLALAPEPWFLLAVIVLQGAAQSTGWVAVCSDVARSTPVERRGTVFGLLSTSYAFGALAAPVFLGWIAYSLIGNWRAAPAASTLLAVTVAALYGWWLAARQQLPGQPGQQRDSASADPRRRVVRNPTVWMLSLADFLLKPVIYATVFWTPVLVRDALPQLTPTAATALAGLLGLAGWPGRSLPGRCLTASLRPAVCSRRPSRCSDALSPSAFSRSPLALAIGGSSRSTCWCSASPSMLPSRSSSGSPRQKLAAAMLP